MSDTRIVTTPILMELIDRGIKHDFNRQLDVSKVVEYIDPDGFHLLSMALMFHEQYKPNVDHHRVFVYMKTKGSSDPSEALMDIAEADWNQLMRVEDFQRVGTDVSANA